MFFDAEHEGKLLPIVYRDPKDVLIPTDGSAEIVSPFNLADYLKMQDTLKH